MRTPPIACFRIRELDNVATLLDDAPAGCQLLVRGSAENMRLTAVNAVEAGHKVALRDIAAGESIVKYGFPIGEAASAIRAGEWVHLHNCRSRYDATSSSLDLHTGARTEMSYE